MSKNKTLIYGFGPYGQYKHNVTMDVLNQLSEYKNLATHLFETRFSRSMFKTVFRQHQGNMIIGLGQDSRARKIRIERRSRNWRKPLSGQGRVICDHGPKIRYVSLKMPANQHATIAYDAGDYVCNYSMYLMSGFCQPVQMKYAFLHLPLNVKINHVVELIAQTINKGN